MNSATKTGQARRAHSTSCFLRILARVLRRFARVSFGVCKGTAYFGGGTQISSLETDIPRFRRQTQESVQAYVDYLTQQKPPADHIKALETADCPKLQLQSQWACWHIRPMDPRQYHASCLKCHVEKGFNPTLGGCQNYGSF